MPPRLVSNLPSATANLADALRIDSAFWIEHGDALERRFNNWAPALCRQQEDEDDDYFDQPECQDPRGIVRINKNIGASPIGQPGNPKEVSRTVTVIMNDSMRFSPERIEVKAGETIRLVLQNHGQLRMNWCWANRMPCASMPP